MATPDILIIKRPPFCDLTVYIIILDIYLFTTEGCYLHQQSVFERINLSKGKTDNLFYEN